MTARSPGRRASGSRRSTVRRESARARCSAAEPGARGPARRVSRRRVANERLPRRRGSRARARAGRGAGPQHVDVGGPRAEAAARREPAPAGYFAAFGLRSAMDGIMTVGEVVESRADGFSAGDAVSHASGWRDYAVVAAGAPALGGLGTLTRLDTGLAPAAALPRPARRHGPDRLRGAVRRRGAARRRRRLGVGRGRRGREPRGAVREAPRPPGDRQRRVGREGLLPARRARTRRRVQPPSRPRGRPAARGRARGDRRLLRLRRRRPPRSGPRGAAPGGGGSRCAEPSPSTARRGASGPATCSRRRPTTSRCAGSAAAATCTGWATWCAT